MYRGPIPPGPDDRRRTVIPAGTEFDEGKKGPWVKLTWEEVETLESALMTEGDAYPGHREKCAALLEKLRVERVLAGRERTPDPT